MRLKLLASTLLLGNSFVHAQGNDELPPYKNPNLPTEERVADLLGRMTLEDKVAQLMQGMFSLVFPSRSEKRPR